MVRCDTARVQTMLASHQSLLQVVAMSNQTLVDAVNSAKNQFPPSGCISVGSDTTPASAIARMRLP